VPARPGAVVYNDLLPERISEFLTEEPRRDIATASRGDWHDEANRAIRISLLCLGGCRGNQSRRCESRAYHAPPMPEHH
jgi:hypothetical protein